MNCSIPARDVIVNIGTEEKPKWVNKGTLYLNKKYKVKIHDVGWKNGNLVQAGDDILFQCEDNSVYHEGLIEDVELDTNLTDNTDYLKPVVWQYVNENNEVISIYENDKVKVYLDSIATVHGIVKYDEQEKKYYVDTILSKYFFFVGINVEKMN